MTQASRANKSPRGHTLLVSVLAAIGLIPCHGADSDWPTYRGDYARSGISSVSLQFPLKPAWSYRAPHPPQPAWKGAAKWDGWHKVYKLKDRQVFDRAFHAVISQGRVYFGSSVDDKIYCLELQSGAEQWVFYTEGPVRLAPTIVKNRIYFGSDDGFVYCLDARSGALLWKTRVGPRDYRVPGNGRVISAWPIRTSVIVMDGLAYCGAGMFPSEGVYLVALAARDGVQKWRQVQNDLPAQGYLLASQSRLYFPAGRNNPVVCDRADGRRLRVIEGSGGTYALLTGDTLVFGPGKTGELGLVEKEQKDQLASFSGNHMIVSPSMSYLHSDTELSALDRPRYLELARERRGIASRQSRVNQELKKLTERRKRAAGAAVSGSKSQEDKLKRELISLGRELDRLTQAMRACIVWKKPCDFPFSLALARDALVAGGNGAVAAFNATDGELIWKAPVNGAAFGLALAEGRLIVSDDTGWVHCFAPGP